jgi:sortase A
LGPEGRNSLRLAERALFGGGIALVALFAAGSFHSAWSSSSAIAAFEQAESETDNPGQVDWQATAGVDQSLWTEDRKQAYFESLDADLSLPQALLEIPSINVKVPVFDGIDELTLNRGVGRIPGTALPGSPGNSGLAGHRDGFFRGLKDISVGDQLTIRTLGQRHEYEVVDTWIVSPEELDVLQNTEQDSVTLVTCYPFYFVGSAPQRFIVRAQRVEDPATQKQNVAKAAQSGQ